MEYYSRRRQNPSPHHVAQDSAPTSSTTLDRHTEPIFIFPTAPFSAPSPSSVLSPQSADLSSNIGSRSRATSLLTNGTDDLGWDDVRSLEGSALSAEDLGVEVWEWPVSAEGSIGVEESMLEEEITRSSRWGLLGDRHRRIYARERPEGPTAIRAAQNVRSPRPACLCSRTASAASSSVASSIPAPHPRIYIPLLSFFASLFSVDDSTLHLISHTPAHSTLFPGCSSLCDSELDAKVVAHGIEALLRPTGERESLKEGIRVACDGSLVPSSPFAMSPVPLTGIYHMVSGIWSGGSKAWQEVWQ